MSATQIQVTFDPAGLGKTNFAFSPVQSIIDRETQAVRFHLSTRGENGRTARFVAPAGTRWTGPFSEDQDRSDGPDVAGLTQAADADGTALEVRGFPSNNTDEQVIYEYVVTVDYGGKTFSSRLGYPSTICVPTGGGTGG